MAGRILYIPFFGLAIILTLVTVSLYSQSSKGIYKTVFYGCLVVGIWWTSFILARRKS
jgi:hypothetical protein